VVTTVCAVTTTAPRAANSLRGIGSLELTGRSGPHHHCSEHSRSPAAETGCWIEFLACAQDKIDSAQPCERRSPTISEPVSERGPAMCWKG
jgi:hypothetical protein